MLPSPREFEPYTAFYVRFCHHPAAIRVYATPVKRAQAARAKWETAKRDSLVSIRTTATEVLLFGTLN